MASLRKLLGQTAIYGFTYWERVLNFALTPLYTYTFTDAESLALYGFFMLIGFITIVLQHAMAIAFFGLQAKDNQDKGLVFGTALCSVMAISLFAGIGLSLFLKEVAAFAGQPGKGVLGAGFWAGVLALDAIAYLPLARLRFDERPTSFAGIQITEIVTNLSLNVFFLGFCKPAYESGGSEFLASLYNPSIGVSYIFISNLVASSIKMVMFCPLSVEFD